MKVYIVATNTDFTAMVKANDQDQAIRFAQGLFDDTYGEDLPQGFEAYPIEEYLEMYDTIEIEFKSSVNFA